MGPDVPSPAPAPPGRRAPPRARWPGIALRLAVAAVFLGWLVRRTGAGSLAAAAGAAAGRPLWLAAGVGLVFGSLVAGLLRWQRLLARLGLAPPPGRTFRYFFIGQFFNSFLLGACGGDMARAFLLARDARGRRAEAVTSVLVDRGFGLLVMVLFCVAMLAARGSFVAAHRGIRAHLVFLAVTLAGSLAALALAFRRNFFAAPALSAWADRSRLGHVARRVYDAVYAYRRHAGVVPAMTLYSLLSLALLTLACAAFGRALGLRVGLLDYFTFFPVTNVLAAVPLTPGGLGVREQVAVTLFGTVGVEPERALLLSLLGFGGGLVWSVFGGALFVARAGGAAGVRAEWRALRGESGVADVSPPPRDG